jgi:hypothetical protein
MKRAVVYVVITLGLFVSCKTQEIGQEALCGTFYKLNNDKYFSSSYTLELRPDSSFTFIVVVKDAKPQCEGKWKIIDKEFILLECKESSNPYEMLSSGYMSEKEHKLRIIDKNKIEYKDLVLKRKK